MTVKTKIRKESLCVCGGGGGGGWGGGEGQMEEEEEGEGEEDRRSIDKNIKKRTVSHDGYEEDIFSKLILLGIYIS